MKIKLRFCCRRLSITHVLDKTRNSEILPTVRLAACEDDTLRWVRDFTKKFTQDISGRAEVAVGGKYADCSTKAAELLCFQSLKPRFTCRKRPVFSSAKRYYC